MPCWSASTHHRSTPSTERVAVAQGQGPQAGLAALESVLPPAWLDGHYLWDAVLADLHRRAGNTATAARHRDQALAAAPSAAVRRLLERRLTSITS
jgi:RNA polymerase sigma-70 factor (ECF subfamily)